MRRAIIDSCIRVVDNGRGSHRRKVCVPKIFHFAYTDMLPKGTEYGFSLGLYDVYRAAVIFHLHDI